MLNRYYSLAQIKEKMCKVGRNQEASVNTRILNPKLFSLQRFFKLVSAIVQDAYELRYFQINNEESEDEEEDNEQSDIAATKGLFEQLL